MKSDFFYKNAHILCNDGKQAEEFIQYSKAKRENQKRQIELMRINKQTKKAEKIEEQVVLSSGYVKFGFLKIITHIHKLKLKQ